MRILTIYLAATLTMLGAQGRGGGRGGGARGGVQTMTLTTTAWSDGGLIPQKYAQSGPEVSPGIQWSGAPQGTVSYVLTFTDLDTTAQGSTDGMLHWLLWNIPGTTTSLPPAMPDTFELEDGTRQLSASGSRYRGPGAQTAGPLHHYILEIYALDTKLDIKVAPQGPQDPNPNPQAIRTSIMQAMAGHIRGRAAYFGLFHR
jgi:Raf kinase inhibitor-like YbhB/YbcL family protein